MIYETKLRTAHQAGRLAQMRDPDVVKARPFWQYIHGETREPKPPRAEHLALDGKVWRLDDPIWQRIYPPNGWGCRCGVVALSDNQLAAQGLTVSKGRASDAIADDDWDYNPAQAGYEADLAGYDPKLAEEYRKETNQ